MTLVTAFAIQEQASVKRKQIQVLVGVIEKALQRDNFKNKSKTVYFDIVLLLACTVKQLCCLFFFFLPRTLPMKSKFVCAK